MKSTKIEKVVILVRLGKQDVDIISNDLVKWLSDHRVDAAMPLSEAASLGLSQIGVAEEDLMNDADLVVVLGGDGTILRAVRLLKGKETPILGVNLGKFGFLAEVGTAQLLGSMEKILAADFEVESRMMLKCEIISGRERIDYCVLNEIFVGRGDSERLLELDVKINGIFFDRIASDGLIFASPTGSTAYALSAGGPVVSPANQLIVLVPVCPHSLFNRSLVLEQSAVMEVRPTERTPRASVAGDGLLVWDYKEFDYIKVAKAKCGANLVKFGQRDFYKILREKLKIYTPVKS